MFLKHEYNLKYSICYEAHDQSSEFKQKGIYYWVLSGLEYC